MGKVFRLTWQLNLLQSCFGLSVLYTWSCPIDKGWREKRGKVRCFGGIFCSIPCRTSCFSLGRYGRIGWIQPFLPNRPRQNSKRGKELLLSPSFFRWPGISLPPYMVILPVYSVHSTVVESWFNSQGRRVTSLPFSSLGCYLSMTCRQSSNL